jgi:glycosyltransferase involved in cell wall biosynthesis
VGWPIEQTHEEYLDVPDIVVEVKKFYKASYIVEKIVDKFGKQPLLILQVDGDTHVCNDLGTNDIIFVSIATDPHMPSETYTHAALCSAFFYCMQTSYMHLFGDRARYIPYGYDPKVHFFEPSEKIYDVVCIGFQFAARAEFGRSLEKLGLRVRFENGPVFDEYRKILNQSWICFNLSAADDLNMRVFESLACGTLLISNVTTDMGRFFVNGVHYAAYTDLDDARRKILYYLEKKDLLREIAAAGHEKVKTHTYAANLLRMFTEIGCDRAWIRDKEITATIPAHGAQSSQRLYGAARQLIEQLRFEDAILVLLFLLGKELNHGPAHHDLALLYFEAGLNDDALRHFELADRFAPDNPDTLKNLANLYFMKGETALALLLFERLARLQQDDADTLMAVAKLNHLLGKREKALACFRKVLAIAPFNVEARNCLNTLGKDLGTAGETPAPLPTGGFSRRKVVIETTHNDYCGGGKYTMQLGFALSRHCDVYLANFDANDPLICGMDYPISPYQNDFIPDLFIASSHGGHINPKGRLNGHVCYFPKVAARESASRYNFAISICAFSDRQQKAVWGLPSFIINPYIPMDKFHIGAKEELILNVGNFFREPDGHSKNQDLVLDWFLKNRLYERFRIVFTGFIGHQSFYNELAEKAAPYPNIEILTAIPFERLRDLYAQARFLIHANGFMRSSPEQTEHFGYIAVEAMASGCQPIVHNSGGCSEIEGVRVWDSFDDLLPLMGPTEPEKLRESARRYSYEYVSEQQLPAFLEAVFT